MFLKKFPLVSLAAGFLTSFSLSFGASTEDVEMSRDSFAEVVTELLFEDPVEVSGPFLTGSGERMGLAAL